MNRINLNSEDVHIGDQFIPRQVETWCSPDKDNFSKAYPDIKFSDIKCPTVNKDKVIGNLMTIIYRDRPPGDYISVVAEDPEGNYWGFSALTKCNEYEEINEYSFREGDIIKPTRITTWIGHPTSKYLSPTLHLDEVQGHKFIVTEIGRSSRRNLGYFIGKSMDTGKLYSFCASRDRNQYIKISSSIPEESLYNASNSSTVCIDSNKNPEEWLLDTNSGTAVLAGEITISGGSCALESAFAVPPLHMRLLL